MATVNREGVNVTDGAVHVALQSGGVIPSPTITGVAGFADGASGAPSIAFTAAPTTGFYRASTGIYTQIAGVDQARLTTGFYVFPNTFSLTWASSATITGSADTNVSRAGANSVIFGAGSSGGGGSVTSRTELNKAVASISNAVATDVLTVTIPNAAHSASMLVRVTGSLGAGGAIGANEATATNTYIIAITRTAGVATVVATSAAFGAAASAVAGAATVTATAAPTAMSGAVGATQTFTVQVTISRSGGSSTNHTCLVYAQLMNANATGITLA
jgi:hypothetical protein